MGLVTVLGLKNRHRKSDLATVLQPCSTHRGPQWCHHWAWAGTPWGGTATFGVDVLPEQGGLFLAFTKFL